jgi:hypothetical protein
VKQLADNKMECFLAKAASDMFGVGPATCPLQRAGENFGT